MFLAGNQPNELKCLGKSTKIDMRGITSAGKIYKIITHSTTPRHKIYTITSFPTTPYVLFLPGAELVFSILFLDLSKQILVLNAKCCLARSVFCFPRISSVANFVPRGESYLHVLIDKHVHLDVLGRVHLLGHKPHNHR